MRTLKYLFFGLVVVLLAAVALLIYLLQDVNRAKPQLEATIRQQTGVPLTIGGDLGWRLWPPVSLSAEDLAATYEGQQWQVGRLILDLDVWQLIQNPEQWRVESLTLADVTMRDEAGELVVSRARLEGLEPRTPAPVTAELTYTPEGQPPLPVTVDGMLAVDPDTLDLALSDARIETTQAAGTCNLKASPVANPQPAPPATEADLIPVETFRAYDWSGTCSLDWVQIEDRRFENVAVTLENQAGNSTVTVQAPRFFGGSAEADIAIDARSTPVRWRIEPTLTGVDSREFMNWLDQRLKWAAPLAFGGTLTFEGNTSEELLASMSGNTRFDGGQGRLDIATIKAQLLGLATTFNQGDEIQQWPDVWQYQRFVGDWKIDRQHHVLDVALDNLTLDVEGDYQPASDQIDMLAELTFDNDPSLPVFEMDPVLYGLPIPVRCRGTLEAPSCRVDPDAAQRIIARALSGEDSELRSKLDQKIEEEVPEQYRDAARQLLDALGGGARNSND